MYTKHNHKLIQEKIGNNIEHFRLAKRKTIKEMASALSLSNSGYRNIERGFTEITVCKIFQIADILNISIFQLLEINDMPSVVLKAPIDGNTHPNGEVYKLYIQQCREENIFLKKQIELLNRLLTNKHPDETIISNRNRLI